MVEKIKPPGEDKSSQLPEPPLWGKKWAESLPQPFPGNPMMQMDSKEKALFWNNLIDGINQAINADCSKMKEAIKKMREGEQE